MFDCYIDKPTQMTLMIIQFFIIVAKVMLIMLIIVGMILLLVGIHHYLLGNNRHELDDSCNNIFRKQIERNDTVISEYNLFRRFLVKDDGRSYRPDREKRKSYKW